MLARLGSKDGEGDARVGLARAAIDAAAEQWRIATQIDTAVEDESQIVKEKRAENALLALETDAASKEEAIAKLE